MTDRLAEKHTNILFFTNDCQLKCEYCYEKDRMENSKIFYSKFEDFKDNLDALAKNDFINSMVIFGGEPTLNMNEIYRTIDYVNTNYPNKFYFYMNTNAVLFNTTEFFNKFVDFYNKNNNLIVTISYDGSANYRRIYKDDNTECDIIMNVIYKFDEYKIPYNISYCLNFFNYDSCISDFIQILQKFKYLNRLVLSNNYNELTAKLKCNSPEMADKIIHEELYKKVEYLYFKFGKPICSLVCDHCKICVKTSGYNYFTNEKTVYKEETDGFDIF